MLAFIYIADRGMEAVAVAMSAPDSCVDIHRKHQLSRVRCTTLCSELERESKEETQKTRYRDFPFYRSYFYQRILAVFCLPPDRNIPRYLTAKK